MTKEDNLINQVCKAWGWRQTELAEKMGYSLQAIRQASSNEDKLTLPMRKHLETLLQLSKYENNIP